MVYLLVIVYDVLHRTPVRRVTRWSQWGGAGDVGLLPVGQSHAAVVICQEIRLTRQNGGRQDDRASIGQLRKNSPGRIWTQTCRRDEPSSHLGNNPTFIILKKEGLLKIVCPTWMCLGIFADNVGAILLPWPTSPPPPRLPKLATDPSFIEPGLTIPSEQLDESRESPRLLQILTNRTATMTRIRIRIIIIAIAAAIKYSRRNWNERKLFTFIQSEKSKKLIPEGLLGHPDCNLCP